MKRKNYEKIGKIRFCSSLSIFLLSQDDEFLRNILKIDFEISVKSDRKATGCDWLKSFLLFFFGADKTAKVTVKIIMKQMKKYC